MSDGEFRPLSGRGAKPAEQQPDVVGIDMAAHGSDQTVYVLSIPGDPSGPAINALLGHLKDKLGADAEILVLPYGIQLSVIRKGKEHA